MKKKVKLTDDELFRKMQESLDSTRWITVTPEYLKERMRRRAEWEKANKR